MQNAEFRRKPLMFGPNSGLLINQITAAYACCNQPLPGHGYVT